MNRIAFSALVFCIDLYNTAKFWYNLSSTIVQQWWEPPITYYFFDSAEAIPEHHLRAEAATHASHVYDTKNKTFYALAQHQQRPLRPLLGWLACEACVGTHTTDLTTWLASIRFECPPPTMGHIRSLYRIDNGIYLGPNVGFNVIDYYANELNYVVESVPVVVQ